MPQPRNIHYGDAATCVRFFYYSRQFNNMWTEIFLSLSRCSHTLFPHLHFLSPRIDGLWVRECFIFWHVFCFNWPFAYLVKWHSPSEKPTEHYYFWFVRSFDVYCYELDRLRHSQFYNRVQLLWHRWQRHQCKRIKTDTNVCCVCLRIEIDDTIDGNLHFYRCFMKLLPLHGLSSRFCRLFVSFLVRLAHLLDSILVDRMQCILSINYGWPFGIQHGSGATPSLAQPTVVTNKTYKVSWKSTAKVITKLWFYGCINHFLLLGCFAPNCIFFSSCFELPKSEAEYLLNWLGKEVCYCETHTDHLNGAQLLGHRHIEIKSDFFCCLNWLSLTLAHITVQ